jgi:hypothetical protein
MQARKEQWDDASAFDVLDESWPEQSRAGEQSAGRSGRVLGDKTNISGGQINPSNLLKPSVVEELGSFSPFEAEASQAGPSKSALHPTVYAKDDILGSRPRRRRSSSAATDSELLRAGPSSPSNRLPSHKLSRTFAGTTQPSILNLDSEDQPLTLSNEDSAPAITLERAPSSSSSQSEQKRTASPFEDEGIGDRSAGRNEESYQGFQKSRTGVEEFGSAIEDLSSSQAALTAEEGTFIEYSNVDSPPPFMKQAWQKKGKAQIRKDIFGPSPLQALFVPPSPVQSPVGVDIDQEGEEVTEAPSDRASTPKAESAADDDDEREKQEIEQTGSVATVSDEGEQSMVIEVEEISSSSEANVVENNDSQVSSPSDEEVRIDTAYDEVSELASDASQNEMEDASIMEPSEDTIQSALGSDIDDNVAPVAPETGDLLPQVEPQAPSVELSEVVNEDKSLSVSSQATKENPTTAFTFTSPLLVRSKRPPPTPSSAHAPLRLLRLRGGDPEVEQLLNTPRSALRSREVKKLVWKLVGDTSHEFRSKKRARVEENDVYESTEERRSASATTMQAEIEESTNGPRFLDRLRQLRASSDGSNRTASSLIEQRKGAKAPTPERAQFRAEDIIASIPEEGPGDNESPSKLLRRWSAANLANEQTNKGIANRGREDPDETLSPLVPRVSVEPPPPSSPIKDLFVEVRFPSLNRPAEHPGMLQIAGDAVVLSNMEALSNGRMTFDADGKRWIRSDQARGDANASVPSLNESLDPFRDIETIVSPVSNNATANKKSSNTSTSLAGLPPFGVNTSSSRLVPPGLWRSTADSELLTPAKNADSRANGSTPRSILKTADKAIKGGRWPMSNTTPILARQANRKISFADGINPRSTASQRKERLALLLSQLGALALASDDDDLHADAIGDSPSAESKAPLSWPSPDHVSTLLAPNTPDSLLHSRTSVRKPSQIGQRSPWGLSQLRSVSRRDGDMSNVSFLTNASFNIAHDRILELLTDIAPWTTRWHEMRKIDLRGRRVESLVRIEEFLPQLEEALLDDNEITYLTGLPNTLRRLFISRNRLPSTAAFGHLSNLELLDVSGNRIDLKALRSLTNLRHLCANNNRIVSLEGLQHLDKLETLHLRENLIDGLEIEEGQWPQLQDLILSRNRIEHVDGLHHLTRLQSLNLDHNQLTTFRFDGSMVQLQQLRVSGNADLHALELGQAINLRTLYADECALHEVKDIGMLHKLDNLSLRQQHGKRSLHWPAQDIRDVKRLFLSGNAFRVIELSNLRRTSRISPFATLAHAPTNSITQFFALIYLELSGCQLTALPDDLAEMTPNVRHLNADYNLLDRLPVLSKLRRLKRLSVVGCRIDSSRRLVRSITDCEELVYFDVRMNPCTLGLYPPIVMATTKRGKGHFNRAFLPPVPHPLFAGVDVTPKSKKKSSTAATADQSYDETLRGMGSVAEKSFFFKKRPPPLLADSVGTQDDRPSEHGGSARGETEDQDLASLFAASDQRFAPTLPNRFRVQRTLHRGCLAMACASLTRLDGLLIDEEEVLEAERYLKASSRGAHVVQEVISDQESSDDPSSSSEGS